MEQDVRLNAEFRVKALIRQSLAQDRMATLLRRGQSTHGALLLLADGLDGRFCLFSQARTATGQAAWMCLCRDVSEEEASAAIARQIRYDEDLWVVEIGLPGGGFPLNEPLLPG